MRPVGQLLIHSLLQHPLFITLKGNLDCRSFVRTGDEDGWAEPEMSRQGSK